MYASDLELKKTINYLKERKELYGKNIKNKDNDHPLEQIIKPHQN